MEYWIWNIRYGILNLKRRTHQEKRRERKKEKERRGEARRKGGQEECLYRLHVPVWCQVRPHGHAERRETSDEHPLPPAEDNTPPQHDPPHPHTHCGMGWG